VSRPTHVCARVTAVDVAVSIEVNGVPLLEEHEGKGYLTTRPLNEWLKDGRNAVRVVLAAGASGADVQGASLEVLLFEADPARDRPAPGRILERHVWPKEKDAAARGLPFEATLAFDVAGPLGNRLFREAAALEAIDDADRDAILAETERFRRALVERRFDDAYRMAALRFDDEARANGFDPGELESAIKGQWAYFLKQDALTVPSLTAAEARLRIVGEGRLVLAMRGVGKDSVRIEGAARTARLALHFAKVGGRWVIAR